MSDTNFAPSIENISDAFNHVLREARIEKVLSKVLFESLTFAIQSGRPKMVPLALATLRESTWSWPDYDYWLAEFIAAKTWPYMWGEYQHNYPNLIRRSATGQMKNAKIELLAHTLTLTTYNVRRWQKNRGNLISRGWQFNHVGCKVEKAIAESFQHKIVPNDWKTWPPFFPGDRSSLLPKI
jgi:hypothetical protein